MAAEVIRLGGLLAGAEREAAFEDLSAIFEELRSDPDSVQFERHALLYSATFVSIELAARGRTQEALEAGGFAKDALAPADPPPVRSWVSYEHAARLQAAGEIDEAMLELEALLPVAENTPYVMHTHHLLAECYRRATRWDEALVVLEAMERHFVESPPVGSEELWLARLHGSRGTLLQAFGLLDMAAREHQQEMEHATRSGDPVAWAAAHMNAADLALHTENHRGVLHVLGDIAAQPLYRGVPLPTRAQFQVFLGVAELELEREDATHKRVGKRTLMAALASEALPQNERIVAHRYLAESALFRGEWGEAEEHLAAIRAALGSAEEIAERTYLLRLECSLLLARNAPREELETGLERLSKAWRGFLVRWRRIPPRPGGVGFLFHSDRRELLSTLTRLSLAVHGEERGAALALSFLLEAEALGTLARRLGLPAVELGEVTEELLSPGHGALVYLTGKFRSHVFAIEPEGRVHHTTLPARDDFRGPLFRLLGTLRLDPRNLTTAAQQEAHAHRVAAYSTEVSQLLFPRAVQDLVEAWDAVSVLGTDLLFGLTPEALRFEDGRWLGASHALDLPPSLTVAIALARRPMPPAARTSELVLVATLDPGETAAKRWGGLQRVSLPKAKLQALSAGLSPSKVHLLHADEVTVEAILKAPLADAPVVHFLVHGVYSSDFERGAALALTSQDGTPVLLTCEDVEDNLRVSGLVLLSACATARGPGRPGDDNLAHLGGAFLAAGARAVVVAQAPVELEATLAFMGHVQKRLLAGDPPAEALRAARAELIREGTPLATLAATRFSVVGLGSRPVYR